MTYTPLRLFLLTLALAGCAGRQQVSSPSPAAASAAVQEQSSDWATMQLAPGYVLVNNVWNKAGAQGPYKQTIFQAADGAFGWSWNWPASTVPVVAYPEVIFGDKPWDAPRPPVPGLPFHPGDKRMVVDFDITMEATGVYNLALEFWPVSSLPGTEKSIASEVMVWLAYQGLPPAGQLEGTVEANGTTFEMWVLPGHGDDTGKSSAKWSYVAFAPKQPVLKGPLDFSVFIDAVMKKGILRKTDWIIGLELGNELQTGTGRTTIRDYKVRLE